MNPDGTITWRELLSETAQRLASAGIADPAIDARRIVEEASGSSSSEIFLILDTLATERGVAHLDSMVARRMSGEPLQYVIGSWSFRGLDLMVDARVLIPRPETEQVVQVALRELDSISPKPVPDAAVSTPLGPAQSAPFSSSGVSTQRVVVDLGTGSGAIGLSIAAERADTAVWITDKSADALEVARANISGLGRAGSRVCALQGNWYEALPEELRGTVEVIISNPPYIALDADLPAEVADWEPFTALRSGPDGLDDLRMIIHDAPQWLASHGTLICEISPEQAEPVVQLAQRYFGDCTVEKDLSGRERVIVARHPSGPSN